MGTHTSAQPDSKILPANGHYAPFAASRAHEEITIQKGQ